MPDPIPRLAATVAVVRDGSRGLEVLLLQRAERGDHNSGAWVFPGGLVDPGDESVPCAGMDDATASRTLGVPSGGLAAYVAAVRECFEESGVLFAAPAQGGASTLPADPREMSDLRRRLHAGETSIGRICEQYSLQLATRQLHYVAHWITPVGRAKRFDTRFFVAVLPPGQESAHDANELLDQVWLTPQQALSPENTRRLMTPTRAVLQLLAQFDGTQPLLEWAAQPREVATILPRLARAGAELRPVLPHEPAWHEVGLLDAAGRGIVQHELHPGDVTALAPDLLRVTSEDGQSHSYLVGDLASKHWAVLGPVSSGDSHIDALIAAAPGPIALVVPAVGQAEGAQRLQALTGARIAQIDRGVLTRLSLGDGFVACWREGEYPQVLLPAESLVAGGLSAPASTPADWELLWHAPLRGFIRPVQAPGETP